MENEIFEYEKARLKYIVDYIDQALFSESPNEQSLRNYIIEERRRIWNDYSQDDGSVDLMQANQTLEMDTQRYFRLKDKLYFLQQTRNSPYFARIDFREDGRDEPESFYIGALSLIDRKTYDILICDWRADIASLYYDAALGPAEYKCNQGTIAGEISLRRQIRIEDAALQYVFDNGINITDPVLMEELGKSTDAKLKTVINTIQREQNRVIRNLGADLVTVQGSAGSGKTSVALHRIAFLLYKYRNSLSSQDVIVFSPSEIFSSYIAAVLPDLGEENAVRTDFFHFLADLESDVRYTDRGEQIERLLQNYDPSLREMIRVKGSASFAKELATYCDRIGDSVCIDQGVSCFGQSLASADELAAWFRSDYASYPREQRVTKIITRVTDTAEEQKESICHTFLDEASQHGILAFTDEEKAEQCAEMWDSCMAELADRVRSLLLVRPEELYLSFLKEYYPEYHGATAELFSQGTVAYEDLFALSWIKFANGSLAPMRNVRQIVVDEAQEHPPIAYMLLSGIFPLARVTVLGDLDQQVDAKISSVAEIAEFFPTKKTKESFVLDKSYRSTEEITRFANRYRAKDADLRVVDRHGHAPQILPLSDPTVQIGRILEEYHGEGYRTNMILCRTQAECDALYEVLLHKIPVERLRSHDTFKPNTTVILPIYLAKGLEADGVIVVGKTSEWNTDEDRGLMYVAATRALHRLAVLYDGEKGEILS